MKQSNHILINKMMEKASQREATLSFIKLEVVLDNRNFQLLLSNN